MPTMKKVNEKFDDVFVDSEASKLFSNCWMFCGLPIVGVIMIALLILEFLIENGIF